MFPIVDDDTPVRFECTACGECCFDQEVALTAEDVRALVEHLGEAAAAAVMDVARTKIAMRRISARTTMCPFLTPEMEGDAPKRFLCSLHDTDAKPLVCRSSPIATTTEGVFHLVPPVDGCPGFDRGEPRPARELIRAGRSRDNRTPA